MQIISDICNLFWGDLFYLSLPGGGSIGISLLVALLIPTGIYFTIRTGFLPIRMMPEMLRIAVKKENGTKKGTISGIQALIISTATRVGTGNMVGVVAAVSAGGPGAVFWMWITALIGSSTAYVEATLAQQHKQADPLYGGYRGGPAYYIHDFFSRGKQKKHQIIAVLFAPFQPGAVFNTNKGTLDFRKAWHIDCVEAHFLAAGLHAVLHCLMLHSRVFGAHGSHKGFLTVLLAPVYIKTVGNAVVHHRSALSLAILHFQVDRGRICRKPDSAAGCKGRFGRDALTDGFRHRPGNSYT